MIIQLPDGTAYDMSDFGVHRLYHHIPSLDINHTVVELDDSRDIITSTILKNRVITVELVYDTYDIQDYDLLRDQLNSLFARKQPFYITFKREVYRRWKVRLAKQLAIEPHRSMKDFAIEFITEQKFAESVATTADLKLWDIDKWGWDGSITWDDELKYRFTTNNFTVKNLGNEIVDPCEWPLEIILRGTFVGACTIRNRTTGDSVVFTAPLTSSDTLTLKNIQTLKNGVSALKNNRDKTLITLAPGNNVFEITGGAVASVAFNFRFPYK